ncbi:MAG: hypothetical protein JXQ87_10835 [Bacteroidia bacterium]
MKQSAFTYELALELIKDIGGKPKVIEALWHRNLGEWFIELNLIVEKGLINKELSTQFLGNISSATKSFICTAENPFPQADYTKEIGGKLREKYDLEFYFPSPNDPDNNCPRWHEKERGIECNACKKLMFPNRYPNMQKNLCYNCNLQREQVKEDEQGYIRVKMFLKTKDECRWIESLDYKNNLFYKYFPEAFVHIEHESLSVIEFDIDTVKKLKSKLEEEINSALKHLISLDYSPSDKHNHSNKKIQFNGKSIFLSPRFNQTHQEVLDLIRYYNLATKAIESEYTFYLHFNNGLTKRDDAFLRFIGISENGRNLNQIRDRFNKFLDLNEIETTLQKLLHLKCIESKSDNHFNITKKARLLL